MKKYNSLTKFRFLIIILMLIIIVQAVYVIVFALNNNNLSALARDRMVTLEVIFVFFEILLGLFVYFYIDKFSNHVLEPLINIFNELENGKLEISLPYEFKQEPLNRLALPLNNMLTNLKQFNLEKKNKIKEYKDRISLIIKNIDDAILILNEEMEIVYINEIAKSLLGIFSDEEFPSIMDFHFEGEVLKYIKEAISKKILLPSKKVYYPKIKKHITFKNGIVHDAEGSFKGMIIAITEVDLSELNINKKEEKPAKE